MTHLYLWPDSCIRVTWLIQTCDRTHLYVWHDLFICVTWLLHKCASSHLRVWFDSFICVGWLIRTYDLTHSSIGEIPWQGVWSVGPAHLRAGPWCLAFDIGMLFVWGTWFARTCDVTVICVTNDSVLCETVMPRIWYRYVACVPAMTCGTWPVRAGDKTLICVGHDSFFVRDPGVLHLSLYV